MTWWIDFTERPFVRNKEGPQEELIIFSVDKRWGLEQSIEECSHTRKCSGNWFSYCAWRSESLLRGGAHWQLCCQLLNLTKLPSELVFLNRGQSQSSLSSSLPFTYVHELLDIVRELYILRGFHMAGSNNWNHITLTFGLPRVMSRHGL